ncbi:hypothetical protein PUNSTDRAFT_91258 [Punctularia strigosozonata HHB-11173 SS5]|uniref:uncharacterized protein n=1 Tax=Punctularia strigosozonata (strain HHB-11173) TaxID=741275 RepID=UPI0004417B58|nr:uncharacterized protein PUNSTDRAFT_91258 [Punctularia strigosozonata HHB-11173 SS5]EIN05685.1 hypothetical protein PUNSTDRAFT_91258 [Punctularia strigosozonata HHB-11173 SS5]
MASTSTGLRKRMGFLRRSNIHHDTLDELGMDEVQDDVRLDDHLAVDAGIIGSSITEEATESESGDETTEEEGEVDGDEEELRGPEKEAEGSSKRGQSSSHTGDDRPERPALDMPKRPPSIPRTSSIRRPPSEETSPGISRRAWYEFDLSVVVALVSPLGNLLTGGDHVRNILLIILLIFYLHQVIEVPWSLYHSSRPRRRAPEIRVDGTVEERYLQLASSELRRLELFFLLLTVISPFLGALLLRRISEAVLGHNAISWFSSGLFVLATGIRPWTHLVERLQQRTTDLHDIVHYPSSGSPALVLDAQEQLDALRDRTELLETELHDVKQQLKDMVSTDEMYEHVDEAIEGVERALRKQERKVFAGRSTEESRIAALEAMVEAMRAERILQAQPPPTLGAWLSSFVPYWLVRETENYQKTRRSSRLHSLSASGSPRLETIPEDDGYGYVSPTNSRFVSSKPRSRVRIPFLNIVFRVGDLATLPIRAFFGYLLSPRSIISPYAR